ncbi:uncharacterized protein LOC117100567 isoform X3 [Anneissia japonica]|uniref:uncharacterized protein LOC117100567 isoform X3 n=1 Tax=Anneissia japonica TaxID=1529436 RepID=UPI001425B1C4|nr:uncharacterized protein LOC117100567 isoform X3 [Anneissia japonica]
MASTDTNLYYSTVYWNVSVTDNSGSVTLNCTSKSGDQFNAIWPVAQQPVTCLAVDTHDNVESCTFNITVYDDENPEIVCPADVNVTTDPGLSTTFVNWTIIYTDNTDTLYDVRVTGSGTSYNQTGEIFSIGITTLEYIVTDVFGNNETCRFAILVIDKEDPIITGCPSDISVNTTRMSSYANVTWLTPNTTDNSGTVSLDSIYSSGDGFPVSTTTVVYTATDPYNNTVICSFDVTVIDPEMPWFINCPMDIESNTNTGLPYANVTWQEPIAMDNAGDVDVVQTADPGDGFDVGTHMVTYTAIDENGNLAECSFFITVLDLEDPVIADCPQNVTNSTALGKIYANVSWYPEPTAIDNYLLVAFNQTYGSGDSFFVGVTTVIYIAVDSSGNKAECVFNITIRDEENPVITNCLSEIHQTTDDRQPTAVVFWTEPIAMDNHYIMNFTSNYKSGDTFVIGVTEINYTAVDPSGNIAICSFYVNITDHEYPVLHCPDESILASTDRNLYYSTVYWNVSVTDNSGFTTLNCTHQSGDQFSAIWPVTQQPVTCLAVDPYNNAESCLFNITVYDDENPEILCPADVSVTTDPGLSTTFVNWTVIYTDNTDTMYDVRVSGSGTSYNETGEKFSIGITTLEYVVTDKFGNNETCRFDVFVTDKENPVITGCPSDISVNTTRMSSYTNVTWLKPNATDNSGIVSLDSMHTSGDGFPLSTTSVVYSATDPYNNTAICSFEVTVIDPEMPWFINCPLDIEANTDLGRSYVNVTWQEPIAMDNSGDVDVVQTAEPGDGFGVGTHLVSYTAIDEHENVAECFFTIKVSDNEVPVFNCDINNVTVQVDIDSSTSRASWTLDDATDNVGVVSMTQTYNQSFEFEIGRTSVTYTATDAAGNEGNCSFDVIVLDFVPPVLVCSPNLTAYAGPDSANANVSWMLPITSDNSGVNPTLESNLEPNNIFDIGTHTVIYTSSDKSKNVATCSFNVTVIDDTRPLLNCPDDFRMISTDPGKPYSTIRWNVTATDNSGPVNLNCSRESGDHFNVVWPTVEENVTCIARDQYDNIASCIFFVLIYDDEPPEIVCPRDFNLTTDVGHPTAAVEWTVKYTDNTESLYNVNISGTGTSYDQTGTEFAIGITEVEYIVGDVFGNINNCSFMVSVKDQEKPVIVGCPNDTVVNTTQMFSYANVTWVAPTAIDNSGSVTLHTNYTTGEGFSVSTTTVVYTAIDRYGNTANCSFDVTVVDPEMPWFMNCPTNMETNTTQGLSYANVTWQEPTAMDNAGDVDVVQTANPDDGFGVGSHIVTYTAIDEHDNVAKCTFTVIVSDYEVPVFDCNINNVTVSLDMDSSTSTANWTLEDATDNVGVVSMTQNYNQSYDFDIGTTVVTYIATDAAGNEGRCSFEVTVLDITPPLIKCVLNVTVPTDPNLPTANVSWELPTASDNSGINPKLDSNLQSYTIFSIGSTEVKYTATDRSNNTAKCSFQVIVIDTEDPILICPPNMPFVETDSRSADAIVTWMTQVKDNSGQFKIMSTHSPGFAFPIGNTTVVYNVQDFEGNTAECSFIITVIDMEKPYLVCPDNVVSNTDKSATWNVPKPLDNSGLEVNLTGSASPEDSWEDIGVYSVIYTATDVNGNIAKCSFNVTVIDACSDQQCLNGGTCQDLGGDFKCICPVFYSGDLCQNEPDSPVFTVFPTSVKANLYKSIDLTCKVANSGDWQWYKDNVPLFSTKNLNRITVVMTIDNQGYYTCSGYGAGPHKDTLVNSSEVLFVVNGTYSFPASLTFNRMFNESFSDTSSAAFKEESSFLNNFLSKDLSLNGDVSMQIRRLSLGSVIADINFYVLNSNASYEELSKSLTEELVRIGNNSNGLLDSENVVIQSTETCDGEKYGDQYTFPDASVGETVDSEETCDESKVYYRRRLANRTCNGDGFRPAYWGNHVIADCGPDATAEQLLKRLMEEDVTLENVEDVSMEVEEITGNAEEITVQALESTAEIMEEILSTDSDSTEVTSAVVSVVDNLFSVEEEILMESQVEDQAPTKIVEVLEEQLSQVEVDEKGVYEVITPNIAVQAQVVDVSEVSEEEITYLSYISESTENNVGEVQPIDESEEIPDSANVSIALPASISEVVMESNMTDFRIVVIVYNDSRLFQSSQFVNESSRRRPNSQVISLSVPGLERVDLDEPILITFLPIEISETNRNTTCVFWDFGLDNGTGGWSPEGCSLVNGSTDGSDRQYCECNHLTNFAILMDFYDVDMDVLPPPADIITKVGLSISILSLFLTVFTFVTSRKFRKSEPKRILSQLCLSLLGLYIVFLTGIDRTDSKRSCVVAGAFLHYFLLSSIFWMSVQAVHMYYFFVKVFDSHVRHFFLKAFLFAWGLPLVIVLISAFIDIDSYVNSDRHCFLTLQRMYYSVAIPVAVSLLFNFVVFIMVLYNLSKLGKNATKTQKRQKKIKSKGMQMLQNGVSIAMVLGLTWLIGFFAIGDASTMMLWLFCILNSFQGFLIFLMYCVRNKEVRNHWLKLFRSVPGGTKRLRSFMSGETRRSSLFSSLFKSQSSGRQRSFSNSSSYPTHPRHYHSENSQVKLGKHSSTSENVNLRR